MALRLSFSKHIVEELVFDGGEILGASYSRFKMVGFPGKLQEGCMWVGGAYLLHAHPHLFQTCFTTFHSHLPLHIHPKIPWVCQGLAVLACIG